jgi:hypothetical protein
MSIVGFALMSVVILYVTPLSYLYCLSRAESWMKSKNEKELEEKLVVFYTKQSITPAQSSWGNKHILTPGQRTERYMIFGKEPLDVVFSADGSIASIYTSYE